MSNTYRDGGWSQEIEAYGSACPCCKKHYFRWECVSVFTKDYEFFKCPVDRTALYFRPRWTVRI